MKTKQPPIASWHLSTQVAPAAQTTPTEQTTRGPYGEPSLAQEYQQLTGNSSQTSDNPQASQDATVTITLSESSEASVSLESGLGATTIAASAATAQYDSVSSQ